MVLSSRRSKLTIGLLPRRLRPRLRGDQEIEKFGATLLWFGLGHSHRPCDDLVMMRQTRSDASRSIATERLTPVSEISQFRHIAVPASRPFGAARSRSLPPVAGAGLTEPPNHDARRRPPLSHAQSVQLPPCHQAGVLFWRVRVMTARAATLAAPRIGPGRPSLSAWTRIAAPLLPSASQLRPAAA